MTNIIIEAYDVWDYCEEHSEELQKVQHVVASNDSFGITIGVLAEDDIYLAIVEQDDEEIQSKYLVSRVGCNETMTRLYDEFLTSRFYETVGVDRETEGHTQSEEISYDEEDEDVEEDGKDEEIEAREDDLTMAVQEFLYAVIGSDLDGYPEEVFEDIKEHFLEYLYREHDMDIYRPMYLYDENGEMFFTEHPYENMVFEEES